MAKPRTAKQKAALRKAQLASARKRKRGALARNVGRGVIGSKRGSRKRRYRVARAVGYAAGGVALSVGAAYAGKYLSKKRGKPRVRVSSGGRAGGGARSTQGGMRRAKRPNPTPAFLKARPATGKATRYNRVFVTTKNGTTSVRKRGR